MSVKPTNTTKWKLQKDLFLAAPKESIGIIYKTTLSPNKVWEFYFRILHILI